MNCGKNGPKAPGQKQTGDFVHLQADATDPQGSYTGVPQDPYEKPVQDADDL